MTQLEQQLGPTDPTQPQVLPLRAEMRAEFSAVRSQITDQGKALRAEMAEQREIVVTHMRVLHEEVLARIALTQEGRPAQPRRRKKQ